MAHQDDFSTGLANEALMDMADRFFGERKSIDDECALFAEAAKSARALCEAALQRADLLHALLLDGEAAGGFYKALGVVPYRLFAWVDPANAELIFPIPRALTAKGRYVKMVLAAYDATQAAFDLYMNGRYYADPKNPAKKRLSMHYKLLKDWSGDINRRIRQVNEGHAPSCVLSFARGLDVTSSEQYRVMGGTLVGNACSLDESLRMPLVDCREHGLKELPELPPVDQVRKVIKSFASSTFGDYRRFVLNVLARLQNGG